MSGLDERTIQASPAWGHMKDVVKHLAIERPTNGTNIIESVSSLMVKGKLVPNPVHCMYDDSKPKPTRVVSPKAHCHVEWAQKVCHSIVPPKPVRKVVDEDEEPIDEEEEEDKGELPDIPTEQQVFNRFGEGVCEEEAFRVAVAIKRLLDKEPLSKARFWGKIIGKKCDYYIAECQIDESRLPEPEEDAEEEEELEGKPPVTIFLGLAGYKTRDAPRAPPEEAKGLNENKYYVSTSDDITDWVQLPDVKPSHIVGARNIYKMFSGDLSAAIDCHPPFPGTERHYLRAQISRISCATTLCPKGIYTTEGAVEEDEEDEDGNKIIKPFEVKPYEEIPPLNEQEVPDSEDVEAIDPVKIWFYGYKNGELLEQVNWVHIAPTLLKEGRATTFNPSDVEPEAHDMVDDGDLEDDDTAPEDGVIPSKEVINPFLSDISHDRALSLSGHSKSLPCWALRKGFDNTSDTQHFFLARSLVWPGSVCYAVCQDDVPGAKYQNFYCGNGLKTQGTRPYAPPLPPKRCKEFPVGDLRLMKDCTYDDELEFDPTPPAPLVRKDQDEEDEEE
eukprot:Tbor_TRINITY_DN7440_c0_g1::TRINITY_DN7440_c0_g1_i1::g.14595::m.14595/K19756/RSPH4A; radial spoke head protein 4A